MKVLIIGLGYVGTALAGKLLADGHQVVGLRRGVSDGPSPVNGDVDIREGDISSVDGFGRIQESFDWVVHCASSSRGGMDAYRAVFEDGTANLCGWLNRWRPSRFVFTSSTSVYPQVEGAQVDEDSPAAGAGETGRILAAAESAFLEQPQSTMLRLAGIYGPDRGHLFLKYLNDEAQITGDPNRYLNQIHCGDVVAAIRHVLQLGSPPERLNVADNEPVKQVDFFKWLSERLGKDMPSANLDPGKRKRAMTNKRVSNRRLLATGFELKYPTFREGYKSEIMRLGLV